MLSISQSALFRYGTAIVLVGAALVGTTQVDVIREQTPFALFFAAVIAAAWFGGHMPGLFAVAASSVSADLFVLSTPVASITDNAGIFVLGRFFVVAIIVVLLTGKIRNRYGSILENDMRYGFLFETNPSPMWIIDPKTHKFLAANDAAVLDYGYSRDEMLKMTLDDIQSGEDVPDEYQSTSMTGPVAISGHKRKDGSVLYTEMITHAMIYEKRPARLIHAIDVTGRLIAGNALQQSEARRARADDQRRASEERLRIVTENTRVGLVMIDADGRFISVNSAYADIFGLPVPEIVGRRVGDVHALVYENQICRHLDRAFAGENVKFELRSPTPAGDRFYDVRFEPTRENRSISMVIGVVTDTTDRNQAELARQASEERYRTLFEYDPDGIVIANPESCYVDANETICRMLGYTHDEIIGMHATNIVVPKEIPHLGKTLSGLNADLDYYREWQFRRRDGSIFPAEVIATTMPDGNTLTLIRDITERKQLEDQLLQAHKMEAIGVLAGGVAHDFNNILTAISGYSDLTLDKMADDDPLRNYILEIKDAGNRAAALTGQLLAFSRKRVLMPTIHNLNMAVLDTEKMLRRIVKENIEFRIHLDHDLGNIKADQGQIAQVIVNLVVNAGDAMPNGGTLTISTLNMDLDEDHSMENVSVAPGPFVELTVSDTGVGMDAQTRRRLFEPFYTTKETGKGTGLGLSTVYGIVKQSGGDIIVNSAPGRGTTFKVYLPRVRETAAEPPVMLKAENTGSGSETILLVEDEVVVRILVHDILTKNGYNVLDAGSGAAALAICENYAETIHLLLTDMVMPKMGGDELNSTVLKLRPGIKSIFMSGYTGDASLDESNPRSETAFIEKPFTPDELVRKVREVLETAPTGRDDLLTINNTAKRAASH